MSMVPRHNNPDLSHLRCEVCNGTGKIFEEHPDGHLSEHVCPYCRGAADSTWVKDRYDAVQSEHEWYRIGIIAWWVATWGVIFYAHTAWLAIGMFVLGVPGGVWMFTHPKPKKRQRRRNPLTTDKERLMAGGVAGGAILKGKIDRTIRDLQQRQQPPQPPT